MELSKDKIKKLLADKLPYLREQYSIEYLGLFGSYVQNEQTKDSDIDILVSFTNPPTLFEFVNLKESLSELIGADVDLVMRSTLKETIGKSILQEVESI